MDSSDGEVDEKEFALADEESEGSAPAGQAGARGLKKKYEVLKTNKLPLISY